MSAKLQDPTMVRSDGYKNVVSLTQDNPLWREGALFNFLIAGEDSQGKLAVVETIQRKGYEPLHQHHPETDVTYYIGQGEMTFYVDGQAIAAPAGTNVFIGRGREYTFTVETAAADTLIVFTPAISTETFIEISAPAWK